MTKRLTLIAAMASVLLVGGVHAEGDMRADHSRPGGDAKREAMWAQHHDRQAQLRQAAPQMERHADRSDLRDARKAYIHDRQDFRQTAQAYREAPSPDARREMRGEMREMHDAHRDLRGERRDGMQARVQGRDGGTPSMQMAPRMQQGAQPGPRHDGPRHERHPQ